MPDDKDKKIDAIETSSEIIGGTIGAVVGSFIAGPIGTIAGGVSGPLLTKVFYHLGVELKNRFLSNSRFAIYTNIDKSILLKHRTL